jgi:tetratricopeptide (TPR) repeat protein
MGGAYNKLKEYQKAIDAYKEAIKIKPDYHEAYYNMRLNLNGFFISVNGFLILS